MLTKSKIIAPDSLEIVADYGPVTKFSYRGITFRVEPWGYKIWGSQGIQIFSLKERSEGLQEKPLVSRHDFWISRSKKRTAKKICRTIDEELACIKEQDRIWFEKEIEGIF